MGSQQPCHNCSCLLQANENDYAHSLECASTSGDLQNAPRTCLQDRASRCSMQLHGQPTALSQLFLFAPSEQERLCTCLRVCIHCWGPPSSPQNSPDIASTADIASTTPSSHSQEPAGPGCYPIIPSVSVASYEQQRCCMPQGTCIHHWGHSSGPQNFSGAA